VEDQEKKLSRRHMMKVLRNLFAFVPATLYLINTPKALAYISCQNPLEKTCGQVGPEVCANYDCDLECHWYESWACFDSRTFVLCEEFMAVTPIECNC
jgi:hypothetical protein